MKKTVRFSVCYLVLLFLVCQNAFTQISVGLRSGVNLSNFQPNRIVYKPKAGANVALLFNLSLNRYLSLQIEPGFSRRGPKIDLGGEGLVGGVQKRYEIFGKIRLGYLEMPVLFQYRPRIGKLEGIVSVGPELRFRLGPQTIKTTARDYENGVLVNDTTTETSLTGPNGYRAFDYGLVGGAGVAYPLSFGRIFTEARYHLGLRKTTPNGEWHNRGMSFHVGVLIPLKK